MRDDTDTSYFAADHLSSASVVMDDTGILLSENRYMPFDIPSCWQVENAQHSPKRTRRVRSFTQPDSIVPDMTNSQTWNRYSYVNNFPIMYVDPSGHSAFLTSHSMMETDGGGGLENDLPDDDPPPPDEEKCGLNNLVVCTPTNDYIFKEGDVVGEEAFIDFLLWLYLDLKINGKRDRFGNTDTVFWNGLTCDNNGQCVENPNVKIVVWGRKWKQSDVNYVMQGMYDAMLGNDLDQALGTAGRFKASKIIGKVSAFGILGIGGLSNEEAKKYLSSDTAYWVQHGWEFYNWFEELDEAGALPNPYDW